MSVAMDGGPARSLASPPGDDSSLLFTSALDQARLIRRGEVSPLELVELYLARIEKLNPRLNAYLTVAADQALAAARAATARLQEDDLPMFHGVPISIKDLARTAGVRTTLGVEALADYVPMEDDAVVAKLKDAGFILLGKTNTPAFGLGCVTEPSAFGPCRNPYDLDRTPGGSSGGAAAALAAGLSAASHGSDGGGSIRIPSSWCGLVGLKPSRGRVSSAPAPSSMASTNGPIARTVSDAAAMLDVMSGPLLGDLFWLPHPEEPFLSQVGKAPGSLRVAVSYGGAQVDPAYREAVERVSKVLESRGHHVEEADPDPTWAHVLEEHGLELGGVGYKSMLDKLPKSDDVDPLVEAMIEFASQTRAETYVAAMDRFMIRARNVLQFFTTYDILLSPTVAKSPPRIGQHRELPIQELIAMWESYAAFTTIWNWTGQPAISLPAGLDSAHLPVGIQLVAPPAEEGLLLRVAAQVAEELPPLAHPSLD